MSNPTIQERIEAGDYLVAHRIATRRELLDMATRDIVRWYSNVLHNHSQENDDTIEVTVTTTSTHRVKVSDLPELRKDIQNGLGGHSVRGKLITKHRTACLHGEADVTMRIGE